MPLLTDAKVKNAKPGEYPDIKNLKLVVSENGTKSWQVRFSIKGGQRGAKIVGSYPDLALKDARELCEDWTAKAKKGVDPREAPSTLGKKGTPTFFEMAEEMLSTRVANKSLKEKGAKDYRAILNNDLKIIHAVAVDQIEIDYLRTIRANMKGRGMYPFIKAMDLVGLTLEWAFIQHNYGDGLDRVSMLKKAHRLEMNHTVEHYRHASKEQLKPLAEAINTRTGWRSMLLLGFIFHTMCRKSEALLAEWDQIDLEKRLWTVPKDNMKMGRSHVVPLTDAAVAYLELSLELGGKQRFCFPGQRMNQHQDRTNINIMLKRMGADHITTVHGTRATASTILNEELTEDDSKMFDDDWIEVQLSHMEANRVRGSYNHAKYLKPRRKMLEHWSAILVEAGISAEAFLDGNKLRNPRRPSQEIEERVCEVAKQNPKLGSKRLIDLLAQQGLEIGVQSIKNILTRHNLNTKELRLAAGQ